MSQFSKLAPSVFFRVFSDKAVRLIVCVCQVISRTPTARELGVLLSLGHLLLRKVCWFCRLFAAEARLNISLKDAQLSDYFFFPHREAKALYSCEAEHSHELSFPQGALFSNGEKTWWKCSLVMLI